MNKKFHLKLIISLFFSLGLSGIFFSSPAQAQLSREIVMASTYGVLAGTLVGVGTLAFTEKPGDHLGNIARGASYGLYFGILLGLYAVYIVPKLDDNPSESIVAPGRWIALQQRDKTNVNGSKEVIKQWFLSPVLNERFHWEGMRLNYQILF